MLFFPEGTRSPDCVMAGFKKGAFSVAVKAGVDVIPITLLGTGEHGGREGWEGGLGGSGEEIQVHCLTNYYLTLGSSSSFSSSVLLEPLFLVEDRKVWETGGIVGRLPRLVRKGERLVRGEGQEGIFCP